MGKRVLKRQLSLFQIIMLGTAGALGSGIFLMSGHAAAVSGPAAILAVFIGGLLSFSIALNYCELATIYPETGGAMTYVREAWGKNLLSFLVGSLDCLSSTFYCALSAVGFAYSLSVLLPSIPIIPVAIAVIAFFTFLNILGVTNVGNAQIFMGAFLLLAFAIFIGGGFLSPNGFHLDTLLSGGRFFIYDGIGPNLVAIMKTIALIYAAYVGFEVIADDAEEVKNPNKVIPIGILVSLTLITLINTLTLTVTMGTLPWQQIAGSETALTDAVVHFLPGAGVLLMTITGLIATLTSVNSSMLSATRESFTLSRDGAWPAFLSRLNRYRVPFAAILLIGLLSALISIRGIVDFLSYITSAGYLFVLFFSNFAMIVLRRKYPAINRPFKAPFFPLTPLAATATCLIVICFSDLESLVFLVGVLAVLTVYYYLKILLSAWAETHKRALVPGQSRIIIPILQPHLSNNLIGLGTALAQAEQDINLCLTSVVTDSVVSQNGDREQYLQKVDAQRQTLLRKFIHYAVDRNVPMYTKMVAGSSIADSIKREVEFDANIKLILLPWPEKHSASHLSEEAVREICGNVKANIGVLTSRDLDKIHSILVPVGGGLHCRLAVQLANKIASQENAHLDFIRVLPTERDVEMVEDEMAYLQEVVITELKEQPQNAILRLLFSDQVERALLEEIRNNTYDLVIIGSSEDSQPNNYLFGKIADLVAEGADCPVLVIKRYQGMAATWLRHRVKSIT
jgi:amino acid transporter/nucleotide-binding universal stress UspA family protein